jgi:hypothetical protein
VFFDGKFAFVRGVRGVEMTAFTRGENNRVVRLIVGMGEMVY